MTQQLTRLLDFEKEKEQNMLLVFQQAQQHVNQQRQKLQSLEQYRVDYLRGISQSGKEGVKASHYQQHLSFVGKLDKACEQQMNAIAQAKLAADQRKSLWLKQQQRVKAVEMLLDKKAQAAQLKANKQEQALFDEFATQKFFRAQKGLFN